MKPVAGTSPGGERTAPGDEGLHGPAAPVVHAEQEPVLPGQQPGLPFPGVLGLQLSTSNAEMEVVKRVTPEHISLELRNGHARALRQLELQEKAIDDERSEREREHERDQRDREEQRSADGRLERMFYVVFGSVLFIAALLILKGKEDLALKVVAGFAALLVSLAGGVGFERLRQERAKRRERRLSAPSED